MRFRMWKVIISSIYLSVLLSAWNNSAPTKWISAKFCILYIIYICEQNSSLVNNGKYNIAVYVQVWPYAMIAHL
jgi:hypothetical protein